MNTVHQLSTEELGRVRQWFDQVQDVSRSYLEPADYVLAEQIYKALKMRVPNSISNVTTMMGDEQ